MDNHLIEGLKRKGFEFKSIPELVEFISNNCKCADDLQLKQKTYYVKDIPFLLHFYGTKPEFNTFHENDKINISVNMGQIAFI